MCILNRQTMLWYPGHDDEPCKVAVSCVQTLCEHSCFVEVRAQRVIPVPAEVCFIHVVQLNNK